MLAGNNINAQSYISILKNRVFMLVRPHNVLKVVYKHTLV